MQMHGLGGSLFGNYSRYQAESIQTFYWGHHVLRTVLVNNRIPPKSRRTSAQSTQQGRHRALGHQPWLLARTVYLLALAGPTVMGLR